MPDFPIVDAHLHLWDPQHFAIPWLEGNATLNQRFTPAEYAEHTQGIAIEAMVYLEVDLDPHYALLEPRWVAERAKEDARIKAIVAHAPVEHGERARSFLDALVAATELVRRCPQVSFILAHLGKPNIKGQLLDPWREQTRELAALPNVLCKVSG